MSFFADNLIFPALTLAFLGWLVPRLLARFFPEGLRPLLMLAFCATVIMFLLGIGFFLMLYRAQGIPFATIFEPGLAVGLYHFMRLALISALLWAPVMILSVAGLPKNWTKEVW
ncbi:hypothetical protein [Aestuariibius sp. HNIBRBA575]|uniref:hypothetical protein n=1 Tax=Aestuariibius sp. HNIBRBA575 TaxID=3233343 RepID=UPI0034A536F0